MNLILSYFFPLFLNLFVKRRRKAFVDACKDPFKAQEELKKKLLSLTKTSLPESPTEYRFYEGKMNLTPEKIHFYEKTSGSSGLKKEIPYTTSLLKSFQNMFLLWTHDLVCHSGIKFRSGKFFMSISPTIGEKKEDDRKYLSPFLNIILSPFLVSNPNNHSSKSGDEFLLKISKDLISCWKLEIISVWSPTYLLSLIEFIEEHRNELGIQNINIKDLWPNLKLISCWTHAQAEIPALKIKSIFPNVMIQGKGLLMTEAPVTIPWTEAQGFVPLITETLIEFWDGKKIIGITEAQLGEIYTLLISQFNGFLRYNTHDKVKISGFYHKTPLFEFIGREGRSTDLAGEKLSEDSLKELFRNYSSIFFVIPDLRGTLPRYFILSDRELAFDDHLRTIYHYDLARKLNQLKEPIVKITANPMKVYFSFCQSRGMVLGDIKEKILFNDLKESERFLEWIDKELSP